MICNHYGCNISTAGCYARQLGPHPIKPGKTRGARPLRLANGQCLSGQCEAGRIVADLARRHPDRFRARHRNRAYGEAPKPIAGPTRPTKKRDRETPAPPAQNTRPESVAALPTKGGITLEAKTEVRKTCGRCKETKPASDFHRNRYKPDGLQPFCAACGKAVYRERKAARAEKAPPAPTGTKRCHKCGETKPVADFYQDRNRKDGLQSRCKICQREMSRQAAQATRDRAESSSLTLDFAAAGLVDLLEHVRAVAADELRTPEAQLLYWLRTNIHTKEKKR